MEKRTEIKITVEAILDWWTASTSIGRGVWIERTGNTPGEAIAKVAAAVDNYPENFVEV